MGYRSDVYLKTTTEGYLIIKRRNDSIENPEHRPLQYAEEIKRTPTGFYKIWFCDIKWYEGTYEEIKQFMEALDDLVEQGIPYSFIRIGEDTTDVEYKVNWTDDVPDEIQTFEPVVDVNDEDWSCYEDITKTEKYSHVIGVMFDLFDKYEECDDIKEALRHMNSDGEVSDEEYDYAILHWEELLKEWEERREK